MDWAKSRAVVSACMLSATSCYVGLDLDAELAGVAGGTGSMDEAPERVPDPAPTDSVPVEVVPDGLERVGGDDFCLPRPSDREIVGVSPEGDLWLTDGDTTGSSNRFEVLDPWTGASTMSPEDIELGPMVAVNPRSHEEAAIVTTDRLWYLEAWSRIELTPPEAFSNGATSCGNPRVNGFVLASGALYERRDDGWWGLQPTTSESSLPTDLITVDGECVGPTDALWMSAPDGTLWRVRFDGSGAQVDGTQFEGLTDAAVTEGTLAVLADAELWLGPDSWTRWRFEAGEPAALAASGGWVWIVVGRRVIAARGTEFAELAHDLQEDVQGVFPHATGVWVASANDLCHVDLGPRVRLHGLGPYQRIPGSEHAFGVEIDEPHVSVSVTVDGEEVDVQPGLDGLDQSVLLRLETLGWHRVELRADLADAELTTRTVWVRRDIPTVVTFSEDVAPIAERHCSGAACHSSMTTASIPVLESFEAWVDHADAIETRVVESNNMPPLGVRDETWGSEEVETIAKWFEGGMQP